MLSTTLSLGSDHAGFELKKALVFALQTAGYRCVDRGAHSVDAVDYPNIAALVCRDIVAGTATFGILICGTGIGMSIAANKINGIRAALAHNADCADYARLHNDANVLCLGAKYTSIDDALAWTQRFLATAASTEPRHVRRVAKMRALEQPRQDNLDR